MCATGDFCNTGGGNLCADRVTGTGTCNTSGTLRCEALNFCHNGLLECRSSAANLSHECDQDGNCANTQYCNSDKSCQDRLVRPFRRQIGPQRLGKDDLGKFQSDQIAAEFGLVYKPCGAGGGDIGLACADDPQALDDLDAVHAGHFQIEQDHVRLQAFEQGKSRFS